MTCEVTMHPKYICPVCAIDGCDRAAVARGWCSLHYQRWQRYGDALIEPPAGGSWQIGKFAWNSGTRKRCTVEHCEEPAAAKGFCKVHYARWRRHGTTDKRTGRHEVPWNKGRFTSAREAELREKRERNRRWREANPCITRERSPYLTRTWRATRLCVLQRDGFRCVECGSEALGGRLIAHHVIARAEGGADDPSNLVTLCCSCHTRLHIAERVIQRRVSEALEN